MNRTVILAALVGSIASAAAPQQPSSPSQPPWTLTENQIRAIVGRVRAGRDLTPKTWPNGARVAVGLSERGLFILTMHPHVIGHRARIAMLDRLVTYMKSKPGVWFATHEEIAKYVKPK